MRGNGGRDLGHRVEVVPPELTDELRGRATACSAHPVVIFSTEVTAPAVSLSPWTQSAYGRPLTAPSQV